MSTLPGNPTVVSERSQQLVTSAQQIQAAADELRALAYGSNSKAVAAMRSRTTDAALSLEEAHQRYKGTGIALQEYAVELRRVHDAADRAAEREANAIQRSGSAQAQQTQARRRYELLRDADAPAGNIQAAEQEVRQAEYQLRVMQNQVGAAAAEIEQAKRELDAAAQRAISQINDAIKQTNDTMADKINQIIEGLKSAFHAIKEWVAKVLKAVIETIAKVLEAVVKAILLVLIIVAAIALLLVVLAAALAFIAVTIALLLTSPLLWLLAVIAIVVVVAVAALPLLVLLGGILAWRYALEFFGATPEIRSLDPAQLGDNERNAYDATQKFSQGEPIDGTDDFMEIEGYTDRLGGDQEGVQDASTVVDIKRVVGQDGVVRWVVTLPSTQDWQALAPFFGGSLDLNDDGAVNDLDTNILLRMFPELQTRYERAVLAAMAKAGVGSTDPVMLVGFSQGGIMAGHLAAHRSDVYNFTSVLAYGSPIDDWEIPATSKTGEPTTVVSIQHNGDPVHTLDLTDPKPNTEHHRTYVLDPQPGTTQAHNNDAYMKTVRHESENDPWLKDAFSDFYGTVDPEDHHLYEFNE